MPVGARTFSEALRWGAEIFHTLKRRAQEACYNDRGGRRGRICASTEVERRSARSDPRSIEQAGYKPGEEIVHRARSGRQRILRQRQAKYVFKKSDKSEQTPRGDGRVLGELGRQYPDRLARRRPGGRRLGRWKKLTERSASKFSWSATTYSSPTLNSSAGHRRGRRQLDSDQGEPDRHAQRDVRSNATGAPLRIHVRPVPPLAAKPKTRHRRHRGGDQRRPDQDRLGIAHRPHRQVQPACSASKKNWDRPLKLPRVGSDKFRRVSMSSNRPARLRWFAALSPPAPRSFE